MPEQRIGTHLVFWIAMGTKGTKSRREVVERTSPVAHDAVPSAVGSRVGLYALWRARIREEKVEGWVVVVGEDI